MAGEVVQPAVQNFEASNRLIKSVTFGPTIASGTSSASGATSLTDGTAPFVVDAHIGKTVYSNGSSMVITTNSTSVLTGVSWTGGTPTAVKPYQIAAAGINGPMGTITLGTVSGIVLVRDVFCVIGTTLTAVSTTSRLGVGVTGSTSLFIVGGTDTATYTANSIIKTGGALATGGYTVEAAMKDAIINANVIGTITGENILTGVLTYYIYWDPISSGATLS